MPQDIPPRSAPPHTFTLALSHLPALAATCVITSSRAARAYLPLIDLNDMFELTEDDLAFILSHQNPYLSHPERGLILLTQLVAHASESLDDSAKRHLGKVRRLVHEDYLKLGDGYSDAALVYRELAALVTSLEDLVLFPALANKTVVGIGGGFSAGKSHFVNSLLGEALLPEALEPSTAVPTFVLRGEAKISGMNVFGRDVALDVEALLAISHDFHNQYRDRFGVNVGFAHVLRNLLLSSPNFTWPNLALLDTPGYNRGDSSREVVRDAILAREHLKNADHVLWLVKATNGDLHADDADFLRDVRPRHPVFFVISQADLLSPQELESVLAKVRSTVNSADLDCAGVGAWGAPINEHYGRALGGVNVLTWLESIAAAPKKTDKRVRCSALLDRHLEHNAQLLSLNRSLLSEFNELLVLADSRESQKRTLERQIARLRKEQRLLKERVSSFGSLKEEMIETIGALLGSHVLDEPPPASNEIVRSFSRNALLGTWRKGGWYDCEIRTRRADLKRLVIGIKKPNVEVHVPYSAVLDAWQRDPQSLEVGERLRARVMEVNTEQIVLAFSTTRQPAQR